MAAFQRTVKLRTPMYFYTGDVWTVTMDNKDPISGLLDEATRQNPKASGMGANDIKSMRKLFLLPRWNEERDNIELTKRMLPADASLAAINVRNGDCFDLVANVEVFACLSVIANELGLTELTGNDPNLGGGGHKNEAVIDALGFRKQIGNTKVTLRPTISTKASTSSACPAPTSSRAMSTGCGQRRKFYDDF